MSHEALQIIWFALWGVLWAVYFALDGFDLGVGTLYPFMGKTEGERGAMIRSIAPFWDGNEVWLITAGGATFAAFPTAYAGMFSYLYSALFLVLVALIVRGVAIEYRGKGEAAGWKKTADLGIFLGSALPALLFGVAFGNLFMGLPMDAGGYHGSLLGLLNPYGVLTGIFFVLIFMMHGALWVGMKAPPGPLGERASSVAGTLWYLVLAVAVMFLVATAFSTNLYENFLSSPAWFAVPAVAVASLVSVRISLARGNSASAFYGSALAIMSVVFTGVVGLFPYLIPSSIDSAFGLSIYTASSSRYTLGIMTVVAAIFVPVVIGYQVWVYRAFRHRLTEEDVRELY